MNKHGLARNIPADVKRTVRQRDGFGCVVCGQAVIEYEHFDPEFAEAKCHDPAGIILLCISCHGLKTRGRLSRETIQKHLIAPKAKQAGFSHGAFDVGDRHPDVLLGNILNQNVPILLKVRDDVLLSVKKPEVAGGPFRLSAFLTDRHGRLQLGITDNEWLSPISNWDVTVVGPRIVIRSSIRDVELVIRTDPPSRLVVEKLRMAHKEFYIECSDGNPTVFKAGSITLSTNAAVLDGCQVGIAVTEDGGIVIGVGGGSVYMGDLQSGTSPKVEQADNVVPLFS